MPLKDNDTKFLTSVTQTTTYLSASYFNFWKVIGKTKRRQEELVGVEGGGWGSRKNILGWNLLMLPREFRDVPFSSPLLSSLLKHFPGGGWKHMKDALQSMLLSPDTVQPRTQYGITLKTNKK